MIKDIWNKNVLTLLLIVGGFQAVFSQELNCRVSINHQKVQATDVSIFESLETGIMEFVNNKRWTDDVFKLEERIDCQFLIIIDSRTDNNFTGSIQVSASRPVFGTNYKTSLFNINDNNFEFSYTDQQALNFNNGEFQSELTAVIAYYAYFILGCDYDSFSQNGGGAYFQKAFDIVTLAQTSSGSDGWQTKKDNNRYWLVENVTNSVFVPFRDCMYKYHRLGLDMMKDQKEEAFVNIINALTSLEEIHKVKPSSYLLQVFFLAKYTELGNMYEKRSPTEKSRLVTLMIKLDPGNTKHYNKILE